MKWEHEWDILQRFKQILDSLCFWPSVFIPRFLRLQPHVLYRNPKLVFQILVLHDKIRGWRQRRKLNFVTHKQNVMILLPRVVGKTQKSDLFRPCTSALSVVSNQTMVKKNCVPGRRFGKINIKSIFQAQ